jgi:hypothetical protein
LDESRFKPQALIEIPRDITSWKDRGDREGSRIEAAGIGMIYDMEGFVNEMNSNPDSIND